jgi:hypothetical protein
MSDALWAVAIMVPLTVLALWINLGRPPKIVGLVLAVPGYVLYGLWVLAAIAAVVWSFFA